MRQALILTALGILSKILTPELFKSCWNFIRENVEKTVEGTETTIDDFIYAAIKGERDKLLIIAGAALEFIETFVLGTASKIDDALVLPAVDNLRLAFNIPDTD